MKLVLGRQNPTFSVRAVQLRADITYSKATVSVIIDERGLNKYARDYVSEVDLLTFAIGKGLIDLPSAIDALTGIVVAKPVVDTASPEDLVDLSVGFVRTYIETMSTADALLGFGIVKELADSVTAIESITGFDITTLYEDFQPILDNADANSGDGIEYTDVKPSADTAAVNDLATADVIKVLTEAVAVVEAIQLAVENLLTDQVALAEQLSLVLGIPLADVSTATDVIAYVFDAARSFADSTLTADQLASIGVEKLLTDAASAVSSGSLRMTDYADITYFAEDYVGTSATFS